MTLLQSDPLQHEREVPLVLRQAAREGVFLLGGPQRAHARAHAVRAKHLQAQVTRSSLSTGLTHVHHGQLPVHG